MGKNGFASKLPKLALASLVALSSSPAKAAGDVFDQFFRYTETEHRAFFSELPAETIDPFTGTLRIVREDLVLPGKAGLDLHIVRSYNSKIWGRADLLDLEPLLAEKEHSVLGYGWTFHFGRLKNPNATGQSGSCSGDFPVYEAPDGTARVFYPIIASNSVFVSKDFWRMEKSCAALSGAGVCIWSDTGVRYELSSSYDNQYYYGGTTVVWPVSGIVDPHGNRISISYLRQSGAASSVTDTYGRRVSFAYVESVDGKRLDTMSVNGNDYRYLYETYSASQTNGAGRLPLPGSRRFLTEVRPPVGPSEHYAYAYDATVKENQYALSSVTYPGGGTISYGYGSVPFFTGREMAPFSVVTQRTRGGRDVAIGTWTYSYNSPGPGTEMHVTTVVRPDGKHDTFKIVGFGYAAGVGSETERAVYGVGLPLETTRADRTEVESFFWKPDQVAPISPAFYSAPVYSDNCGPYFVWEPGVNIASMTQHTIQRDRGYYVTDFSDFDSFNQARTVIETGYQSAFDKLPDPASRSTTWSYFSAPKDANGVTLNLVRKRPATQHVCVGTDCFDNGWTYNGPDYALDSSTLSGVKVTFGHHLADLEGRGNLWKVTNALGHTLTLNGYSPTGTPTSIDFNGAFGVSRTTSWEGWILSETNGRGHTTTYNYDVLGRLRTLTPPGSNDIIEHVYAADGSWSSLTRGSYSKSTTFDGFGQVTSTSDSEGTLTSTRYDSMGRKWFASYPSESAIGEVGEAFSLDGLGRIATQTRGFRPASASCDDPNGCTTTNTYRANCVIRTVQRALDDSTKTGDCSTSYGDPDEKRLTQAHANYLWQYAYSAAGKLVGVTAPLAQGNRGSLYDARQFLTSETSGESGTTGYGRNAIGQMTSRTDARGVIATYGYDDPLSRLRTISFADGSSDDVSLSYDNANNTTRIESANGGVLAYVYDELDRMTSQTWTFGGRDYTTSYRYDPAGCLDLVTYPTGTTLTMKCDSANRTTSISIAGSSIVRDVLYHPSGQVRAMTYGNATVTSSIYDDRGRLQSVTASGVIDLSYKYDGADNVRSFDNAVVPQSSRTLYYDNLDRLYAAVAPDQWGTAIYYYDRIGNRDSKFVGGTSTTYVYGGQTNRLDSATGAEPMSITYDSAGNMTEANGQALTWNLAGRLASSSDGATYQYDGHGRRVQKRELGQTTLYHYDAAGRVIAETLPDGTKLRDYIYLANGLVAVDGCMENIAWSSCTERQWYHTDALGSVLARTDASGSTVARFDYQPWGEQWTTPAVQGDRQYNGRVYDPGTGLHDYGARMYWPQIGRFISADTHLGGAASPASLNRYTYVLNNPYKYLDPTGEEPGEIFPTEEAAVMDALKYIKPLVDSSGQEYAGSVYAEQNGFTYTKPSVGTVNKSDPSTPPRGLKILRLYHGHPFAPGADSENFSDADMHNSENCMAISYLATPLGAVKLYVPVGASFWQIVKGTITGEFPGVTHNVGFLLPRSPRVGAAR